MRPLISSCFYPLIGERIFGVIGKVIDILAVFATLFGIATSLGIGALQISAGMAEVFPLAPTMLVILIVIGVVTVLFLLSSMTGLNKGIQILSKANIIVAIALLLFMLIVGPTSFVLNIFTSTTGDYLATLIESSLNTNPFQGFEWTKSWTVFYWAWWISWSPFVGLFVASISRGRTIREFIVGALVVPALLTFLWFAVFGGAAFHLEIHEGIGVAQAAINDVSTALFRVFDHYPLTNVLSVVTIVLLAVFFITSGDSATFVLAMMTTDGDISPPLPKKLVWGIIESATASILLIAGGLEALQRMAIVAALPFALVMLLMCRSLYKAMRYELKYERPVSTLPVQTQEAVGESASDAYTETEPPGTAPGSG